MHKVLSVRIPEPLYRQAEQLAKAHNMSMNSLITQAVALATAQAEEDELRQAFSTLGARMGSQVGYAMPAQRKHAVARRRTPAVEQTHGE